MRTGKVATERGTPPAGVPILIDTRKIERVLTRLRNRVNASFRKGVFGTGNFSRVSTAPGMCCGGSESGVGLAWQDWVPPDSMFRSLSLSPSLPLPLSPSPSRALSVSLALSRSLSLAHTLSYSLSLAHTLSRARSLSLALSHTLSRSL